MTRNLFLLLAAVGAAILIAGLVYYSGIGVAQFAPYLDAAKGWAIALVLLGTAGNIWFGSLKWRATMRRIAPESANNVGSGYYFFYTCLTAVMTQLLTVYLAGAVVRGFAARHHQKITFMRGATSSGIEQIFDAYLIVLLAVPAVLALLAGAGFLVWGTFFALFLAGGLLFLHALVVHPRLRSAVEGWLGRRSIWPLPRIAGLLKTAESAGFFTRHFVYTLYGLSFLRYVAIGVRTAGILLMAFSVTELLPVLFGFTLVQASQFAALTPGNLGITEWSWAAVLLAFGWELDTGAAFAFVLRAFGFAAILAVFAAASVFFLAAQYRKRARSVG